jgi:hypothetical protein
MRRLRFRIGTLSILIIALSLGLAALRDSNDAWDGAIFSLTLGALLVSILNAIYRCEKRRAFWVGFALFGLSYLGLSLVPPIESRLITTKALAYIDSKVPRSNPAGLQYPIVLSGRAWDTWSRNLGQNNLLGTWSGTTENFMRIGHSLLALIAAFVGGRLSSHLYAERRRSVQGPLDPLELTSRG